MFPYGLWLAISSSSDDLQFKILRELTSPNWISWDRRQSYASLGRKLGADEEAVRIRLKRLSESGFLHGWQLIINPHLIGLELGSVMLDSFDNSTKAKDEIISQLEPVRQWGGRFVVPIPDVTLY